MTSAREPAVDRFGVCRPIGLTADGSDGSEVNMLEIDVAHHPGRADLLLFGDLDLAGVPTFQQVGRTVLAAPSEPVIAIDLSAIDILDSAGLGSLLGLRRRAVTQGISVQLVCPPGRIRDLLELVRFDRVFEVRSALPTTRELGAETA